MTDSAIGMSDVTITPSDSASQAPKPAARTANSSRGGPRKGPAKPSVDKAAPPGAVQVDSAGSKKSGKSSQMASATIPLSGWGEIDLYPFRRDIEPVYTVDAQPYSDLVDTVYTSIQSRFSAGGKHIPLGLFRYYCFTLWWMRVLWLHKSNANTLTTDEKAALNVLSSGETFQVPSHIAQYLSNLGNFVQGGENFFFRKRPVYAGFSFDNQTVKKGWFETPSGNGVVDADSWWFYSQLPSPGVYTTYAVNEADVSAHNAVGVSDLSHISPVIGDAKAYPTDNIVGWSNAVAVAHHSSWRATYSNLGWSGNAIPADMQTGFNISTSTLKWMSERLSTLKDFKCFSSTQLTLSVQGAPFVANYLRTEEPSTQMDQRPPVADVAANLLNATRFSELAVASRYAIDSKSISAAFSFGYRLERTRVFERFTADRSARYHVRSNYQPWLFTNADGTTYVQAPLAWFGQMNAPLEFGSQPFLNVVRFSTHQLNRSVGLDAALVLSEAK